MGPSNYAESLEMLAESIFTGWFRQYIRCEITGFLVVWLNKSRCRTVSNAMILYVYVLDLCVHPDP